MFTIYLHIKFHMPCSNGLLITTNKLKAKYTHTVCTGAILLFYTLQKLTLVVHFLKYFLALKISWSNSRVLGVAPLSLLPHKFTSAMFTLLMPPRGMIFIPCFLRIHQIVQELFGETDKQTSHNAMYKYSKTSIQMLQGTLHFGLSLWVIFTDGSQNLLHPTENKIFLCYMETVITERVITWRLYNL